MEEAFAAAVILSGIALGNVWFIVLGALLLIGIAVLGITFGRREPRPKLTRAKENPIIAPTHEHPWESEAVFNPAALVEGGRVHLLYRALGHDGVSRIGYASSADGIHFDERLPYPVFTPATPPPALFRNPFRHTPDLHYNTDRWASGGGWGGSEDPRAVKIDGRIYMLFSMFESWQSMRIALTSIDVNDFASQVWEWEPHFPISPRNETNKNWVLFPEKINGKFAILHALTPSILISYFDSLDELRTSPIQSNNHRTGRPGHWDAFVRGAAAPPLKTSEGWLLLYHGMNPEISNVGYKIGAMILDSSDPTVIKYRSAHPILEPKEWYENDWKPGVVYASGAVIKDGMLYVYYGGGDKTVNVATAPIERFLKELMRGEHATLEKAKK